MNVYTEKSIQLAKSFYQVCGFLKTVIKKLLLGANWAHLQVVVITYVVRLDLYYKNLTEKVAWVWAKLVKVELSFMPFKMFLWDWTIINQANPNIRSLYLHFQLNWTVFFIWMEMHDWIKYKYIFHTKAILSKVSVLTCWYFLISFWERMALNSSLFWLDILRSCSVIHRWKIPTQFTHTNSTAFATSCGGCQRRWEERLLKLSLQSPFT